MTVVRSQRVPRRIDPKAVERHPTAFRMRPFIDLGTCSEAAPLAAQMVEQASLLMQRDDETPFPTQLNTEEMLRSQLLQESGLWCYMVDDPRGLRGRLQTPGWNKLVERLLSSPSLRPAQLLRLASVLNKLGFYRTTLQILSAQPEAAICAQPYAGKLELAHLNAGFKAGLERPSSARRRCERVAQQARDPRLRLKAALLLVVHHARVERNREEMERWGAMASSMIASAPQAKDFESHLQRSIHYRAVSFVPFYKGQRGPVVQMLGLAQAHALEACRTARGRSQELLAQENLHPVLETRGKEAEWLGDHELALQRREALVAHDPFDPKCHVRLGDTAFRFGRHQIALRAFTLAARLGAPYTAYARWMRARCHFVMGDEESALQQLRGALHADPWSLSASAALEQLGARLGRRALSRWARMRRERILEALRGES